MKKAFWITFAFLLSTTLCTMAQNQLGKVTNVNQEASCPQGYFTGMQCFQATVSCPNLANIQVTYGYENPAGTPVGTVFFHDGSGGTQPYGAGLSSTENYLSSYLHAGYQIVQMSWATDWEIVGGSNPASIAKAACRPATLMQYIYKNVHTTGAMCAQGQSAGSAAIAYALTWYNAATYLDKVELISGPVFGNIQEGCAVPNAPPVTICPTGQFGCVGSSWQDVPEYAGGYLAAVRSWTQNSSCQGSRRTTDPSNDTWQQMSLANGTSEMKYLYPQTAMGGWLCSNGLNNSAAQGQYYYLNFTTSTQTAGFSLTRVDNCEGAEGVEPGKTPSGETAFFAIVSDMTDASVGCVQRH